MGVESRGGPSPEEMGLPPQSRSKEEIIRDTHRVPIDSAQIGAQAEKPLRDAARKGDFSSEEKLALDEVAAERGQQAMMEDVRNKYKMLGENLKEYVDKQGGAFISDEAAIRSLFERFVHEQGKLDEFTKFVQKATEENFGRPKEQRPQNIH